MRGRGEETSEETSEGTSEGTSEETAEGHGAGRSRHLEARGARGGAGQRVLDVLANGSGFMRVDAAGQSRDDVYVSPAQIHRCELRAGDQLSGPLRPPRRDGAIPR